MRFFFFLLLQFLVFLPISSLAAEIGKTPLAQNTQIHQKSEAQRAEIKKSYGKLPLSFIENKGQVDHSVRFYERGAGHATFFTEEGLVLALSSRSESAKRPLRQQKQKGPKAATEALRLTFVGANKEMRISAGDKLPGHVNYFTGNDKTQWLRDIPTYRAITYEDVYKNIDIRFYGNNRDIEHDVIVRPGGDFSEVTFAYRGIKGLNVNKAGDLVLTLKEGKLIQKRPFIYQVLDDGKRVTVDGSYRILKGDKGIFTYGFTVASYDRRKDLVIDPVLLYSTYLGGSSGEAGYGIAIDNTGAAYITGYTISPDFPLQSPLQGFGGGTFSDAFITKINPAGNAIVYSTFLGGSNADNGLDIAVDSFGAAYIAGRTSSIDFPILSAVQPVHGGVIDVFVTKLNPAGNALIYSTFLGGSDEDWGNGIAVDSSGSSYVTGFSLSKDYPLVGAAQAAMGGPLDAIITKLTPTGSAIVYSTYLGGSAGEYGIAIAVDNAGAAYVTGPTWSTDFPTVNPAQAALGGISDTYITKVNPAGKAFDYSTYLGGSDEDAGTDIVLDNAGAAYITGYTFSADFPLQNPLQGTFGGISDAFVTKLDPTGSSYVYSTYLGGSDYDSGQSIAVNSSGAAYVVGYTFSLDFPLIDGLDVAFGGQDEAFVTELAPDGAAIVYSTYIGGKDLDYAFAIAVDNTGAAYVTGNTLSGDFPLKTPLQAANAGSFDAFITKISTPPLPLVTLTITPDVTDAARGGALGYTVTATNTTNTEQCFQYWERVTLPGGAKYPPAGEFFGPVNLCLTARASQGAHFIHGLPAQAPLGIYIVNAYIGTHPTVVQKTAAFNFSVTAFSPAALNRQAPRPLMENGFIR